MLLSSGAHMLLTYTRSILFFKRVDEWGALAGETKFIRHNSPGKYIRWFKL